jgi:hypothetical protein
MYQKAAAKRFHRSFNTSFIYLICLCFGVSTCSALQGIKMLSSPARSCPALLAVSRRSTLTSTTLGRRLKQPLNTRFQEALTVRSFQTARSLPRNCLTAFLVNQDSSFFSGSLSQSGRRRRRRAGGGIPSCTQCWLSSTTSTDESTSTMEISISKDDSEVYKELQWLAVEIKRHDVLYYNNNADDSASIDNDSQTEPFTVMISDDEYDALAQREADLCQKYPLLLARWQQESGLGSDATRYGGRVGAAAESEVATTPTAILSTVVDRVKRHHMRPMLSLDNVNNDEELLPGSSECERKSCRLRSMMIIWAKAKLPS